MIREWIYKQLGIVSTDTYWSMINSFTHLTDLQIALVEAHSNKLISHDKRLVELESKETNEQPDQDRQSRTGIL